jgi:hypothetical protein
MSFCSKPQRLVALAAVLTLFVGLMLCPDLSVGKTKKPASPTDTGDTVMVNAVDEANQQVTLLLQASSQKVVYSVDGGTTITVQGTAATLKQVHSGLEVYSYVERDSKTLDSIDVGPVRPKTPDQ